MTVGGLLGSGCGGSAFAAAEPDEDAGSTADRTEEESDALDEGQADGMDSAVDAGPDAVSTDAPNESGEPDAAPEATVTEAAVEVGDEEPPCLSTTHELSPEADGIIPQGACHGANSFLTGAFGNVGTGRGLLRFALSDPVAVAFASEKVKRVTLVVPRNQDCEGEVSPCPAQGGRVFVHPLRVDWSEGIAGQSYTGADWCRRQSGNPGPAWDAAGADAPTDHGALIGEVQVSADQPSFQAELDVGGLWIAQAKLSVLLIPEGAVYCFATRESQRWPSARLEVEICE